jgi:glycerophosphoryl diester phosphodiesterase
MRARANPAATDAPALGSLMGSPPHESIKPHSGLQNPCSSGSIRGFLLHGYGLGEDLRWPGGRLTRLHLTRYAAGMLLRNALLCLVGIALSQFSTHGGVLVIGHRGDSLFAPENTVASYASAVAKQADFVELDARASSDNVLVVMHDATVDRTTDGTGSIAGMTLAQLQALDAGSWFAASFAGERIPTFAQALQSILPRATPLIHQYTGTPAQFVTELASLGCTTNVVVQSFDWGFLSSLHALDPRIPLAALGQTTLTPAVVTNIINAGARTVAWEQSYITSNEVALVHGAGLSLFVWTVDGPTIKRYIDMGVDGIISNDPGMAKALQQPGTNNPSSLGNQLMAYWKMDDGLTNAFATTVADSKGTNSASLVRGDGASHWFDSSMARFGGCVKLDGLNAYVTLPQPGSMDINTNAMTFSAWVWLTALPSQLATSYGAIYDSTTDCYVLYLDRTNKELRFKITDVNAKAARPGIPEALLKTNKWLHIAGTYSGQVGPASGQVAIYLNGQAIDVHTGDDGTSPVGLTGNVKTGQAAAMGREGPTGGNYFTGFVDDVAIWRRALAAAEVAHLYGAGMAGAALADLVRQPTSLIRLLSASLTPQGNQLQIVFQNQEPWQSFRLLHATDWSGPFLEVPGLTSVALGHGTNLFNYPLSNMAREYFRIEGQ